jgi:hypothetical protein
MRSQAQCSTRRIAGIIRTALAEGHVVEIDGLGVFQPGEHGSFDFIPSLTPRVFIAYVEEDVRHARRLYRACEKSGLQPWLDKEKLLPGQNWPRSIQQAIEVADFFVPCFSRKAAKKRGAFQSELRYALDCATKLPLEDVFILPVRLDDCDVPRQIAGRLQYIDLFPHWDRGVRRLIRTIVRSAEHRRVRQAA